MQNYRPQCFVRTADITVALTFPEGTPDAAEKMVMPGDNVEMVCDLVFDVALEIGTRFTLREANKTSKLLQSIYKKYISDNSSFFPVGTGIVTKIFE